MSAVAWSLLHQGAGRGAVFLFFALLPALMPLPEVGRFAVAHALVLLLVSPLFESALALSVTRAVARGEAARAKRILIAAPPLLWIVTGVAAAVVPPGSTTRWLLLHVALVMPLSLAFAFCRGHGDLRTEGIAGTLQKLALLPALLVSAAAADGAGAAGAARAMALAAAAGWVAFTPFAPSFGRRYRALAAAGPRPVEPAREAGSIVLLAIVAAAGLLLLRTPLFVLERTGGGDAAGLFATAQRFAEAAYAVPQAVMLALFPRLAGDLAILPSLRRRLLALGGALALALAGVALLAIPRVYPSDGAAIASIVLVLALSVPAVCLGTLQTQALVALERPDLWLGATGAGLAIAAGGTLALAPAMGAQGAAVASVGAELAVATLSLVLVARVHRA